MAKLKEFVGKERMLSDWNRVLMAILRADAGQSDIKHARNEEGDVTGLNAEIILKFDEGIPLKKIDNYDEAVKIAKSQLGKLVEGTFTSKQRLLIDWMSMKNSIVRAQEGEIKIGFVKNDFANLVVGVTVEVSFNFGNPVPPIFSDEEKEAIDKVQDKE